MKNKLAAIEGILFSMGTSVTRRQLMEALEIDDEQFDELIKLLQTEYDKEERGIRLLELDDAYGFVQNRILWIIDKNCESSKETKAYGCNA